ncbi:unnamed protein product, partial [Ilex paraguariensis]
NSGNKPQATESSKGKIREAGKRTSKRDSVGGSTRKNPIGFRVKSSEALFSKRMTPGAAKGEVKGDTSKPRDKGSASGGREALGSADRGRDVLGRGKANLTLGTVPGARGSCGDASCFVEGGS